MDETCIQTDVNKLLQLLDIQILSWSHLATYFNQLSLRYCFSYLTSRFNELYNFITWYDYCAPVRLSKWCKIQHFKILFIFNIYSFIFNICIYSALLFVQNSAPLFIFNSSICSQNYYPFRNYLSIQQLFIHSRFTAHLSYAWK